MKILIDKNFTGDLELETPSGASFLVSYDGTGLRLESKKVGQAKLNPLDWYRQPLSTATIRMNSKTEYLCNRCGWRFYQNPWEKVVCLCCAVTLVERVGRMG